MASASQMRHMSSTCLTSGTTICWWNANFLIQKSNNTVAGSRRSFHRTTIAGTHWFFFKLFFPGDVADQPRATSVDHCEKSWRNNLRLFFVMLVAMNFPAGISKFDSQFLARSYVLLCVLSYFRDITLEKKLDYYRMKMAGDCLDEMWTSSEIWLLECQFGVFDRPDLNGRGLLWSR